MNPADAQKRAAAEAALSYLPSEGVIGLGTGSTARFFIEGVGRLVREGRQLQAVATSEQSRQQALELDVILLPDSGPWDISVCVDGADEVSEELDLIKGGGGAHTREKIVNSHSRQNIIVVDENKLSRHLGEKWAVPVEVLNFGSQATAQALGHFGRPVQRKQNGSPVRTDSGHLIYDLEAGVVERPHELERELKTIPGVVETGLFCSRADVVLVAGETGVRTLVPRA